MSDVDRQGTMKSPRAPPRHLRAVGRLEWFLFARTKLQADSCVIVAARYLPAHSGDVINKASLYPALGEVVRNNVALASRIAPASGRRGRPPEWVRLPSLDLDRVVEFIDDDFSNLESVFESQFTRGFDPDTDLPLWRLAVLRDGTLIFAFDHALCDGLSGLAFHRLLLKALQEDRTSPTSVQFAENQHLPPALEEATHISIPWRTVFRETLKLFNPCAWRRHLATWAGNRIPPSFELDMRVHILTYAPDEAQRLLALTREHGATLTATVHTVSLLVLSRLLARQEHGKFRSTTTYVPISLRSATGAPPDAFCNHYSYHFSEHQLFSGPVLQEGQADFPWTEAARFARELKAAVPHAASAMGLLKLVGSPGKGGGVVRRPLGHRRMIGIELSNLGAYSSSLGEEEEELEGRHAVQVVPTPAVAVAEAVKSQDASRGAGDAAAGATTANGRAETTEIAAPTASAPGAEIEEKTDAAQAHVVRAGAQGERPVVRPESVPLPESPVSAAASVAEPETGTETETEAQGRARETIAAPVPAEGDKEKETSPGVPSARPRAAVPAPRTTTKLTLPGGLPTDSESSINALNGIHDPSPSPSPEPEPAGKIAFPEPNPEPANVSAKDDSEAHPTTPAKDSSPHAEAHARARTTSEPEPDSNSNAPAPRPSDRLQEGGGGPRGTSKPDPELEPELELVSPHRPMGNRVGNETGNGDANANADPPHPTSPADANPAPTGNVRNTIANSSTTATPKDDNEAGQARPVGNDVPTQAQEPSSATPEPLWAIRDVLFAQGDGTLGAALKVCVAGTPGGGLGVVISWGRSAVDEEFGKEFVVGFADAVRDLVVGVGVGGERSESLSQPEAQ